MRRDQLKLGMIWSDSGSPSYIALDQAASVMLGKTLSASMFWSIAFREERSLWLVWTGPEYPSCRIWLPDRLDDRTVELVQAAMHRAGARGVAMTPLCPRLYEQEVVTDGTVLPQRR
jgi:hypothetical protein